MAKTIRRIMAACVLTLLSATPPQAASKPVTAKAGLAEARKTAKAWQADAEPTVIVSTGHALADGRASYEVFAPEQAGAPVGGVLRVIKVTPRPEPWLYLFYSKATGKGCRILFGPQGPKLLEESSVSPEEKEVLPNEFVDSDQAMAEAVRNGFQPDRRHKNSMRIGTCHYFPEPVWVVYDSDKKDYMYVISARTGKFLRKTDFILSCSS